MLNLRIFFIFCISAGVFGPFFLVAGDYESAELCIREKNFSEAVKLYRKAAEKGHAEAQAASIFTDRRKTPRHIVWQK